MERLELLDLFIEDAREEMLIDLTDVVDHCKAAIVDDPEACTEIGAETPSVDVRLCIDLADIENHGRRHSSYTFRTGLSDYDQSHSEYCAALSVESDTDAAELLTALIEQLYA